MSPLKIELTVDRDILWNILNVDETQNYGKYFSGKENYEEQRSEAKIYESFVGVLVKKHLMGAY